jgi:regulator of sirC expression with transglutaminase-like and TPR domain
MTAPDASHHSAEYVTLRDYIDARFCAQEKATEKAYQAMERRLDGMNEFRETLRDQSRTFVTKAEYNVSCEKTSADIRDLLQAKDIATGKASQSSVNMATGISITGLVIAIISLFLKLFGT